MNSLLNCTAEILEKVGAYLDTLESDRAQAKSEEQMKTASLMKEKFNSIAGDEFDASVFEKLSSADPEILKLFEKVALSVENVESLGGPSEADASPSRLSKQDEIKLANDRFAAWALS